MKARADTGKPAHIRFTHDWHELLGGDLRPGAALVLRYDPARVVPEHDGYVFGDPKRPVTAWIDFGDGAPPLAVILQSDAGVLHTPDRDVTGHGSMLSTRLQVPAEATGVSVWFSYLARSGTVCVDDDHGARFRFGFCAHDLALRDAWVTEEAGDAAARFGVEVGAHADVSAVRVSWRVLGANDAGAQEADLQSSGVTEPGGWTLWRIDAIAVPKGAKVRFKLFYWRGGARLKDDNAGQYYLAPQPPDEVVPPPPEALAREALRW
jgi:hypothetical protein